MAKKEEKFSASFEELKEALKSGIKESKEGGEEQEFGSTVGEEWNMTDEGDDLMVGLPKVEVEEEEVIEEGESKQKEGKTKAEMQDEKLKEDLIEHLEESGDTKVTIKGKEYDLRDLSPQEIKDRFSKAGRFYERMEEISKKEQELNRRAQILEQTVSIQRGPEQKQRVSQQVNTPDFLKENFEDTEEVKLLKESQRTLIAEIDTLKSAVGRQGFVAQENRFFTEAEKFKKDYPCASMDEVMLLKKMRPGIPTEKIMERSHQHYSSQEFIETALEANPEVKRTLYEKAIGEHKSRGEKSSKIGRGRSSSSGSGKITSPQAEEKPKTWAEADKRAKAYLKAVRKAQDNF